MKYFEVYDSKTVRVETFTEQDIYTSTETSDAIDVRDYEGKISVFVIADKANAGTIITHLEQSVNGSTSFTDLVSVEGATNFTTITSSVSGIYALNYNVEASQRYIRAVTTFAAGANSCALTVFFMGKKSRSIGA